MKKLCVLIGIVLLFHSCIKEFRTPPSPERLIKSFALEQGQYGDSRFTIEEGGSKIIVQVLQGTDLKTVQPTIIVSDGAAISPVSGTTIDVSQDRKYTYTVTSASGLTMEWEVQFDMLSIEEYGTYVISDGQQSTYLSVLGDTLFNKKYDDGAGIGMLPKTGDDVARYQKWHLIRTSGSGEDSYYQIRNLHSGKLLTAIGDNPSAENTLTQASVNKDHTDRQLWRLGNTEEVGYFQLVNKHFDSPVGNVASVIIAPIEADAYRDDNVVQFFNRNSPEQGSVAFDQGTSIPLDWGPNKGKVLWITQDAWDGTSLRENSMFPCGFFFSYGNSMLLQPSINNWDNHQTPNVTVPGGANGRPRQVCTILPDHTFSWPSVGVEIGDKVYIHSGEGSGMVAAGQSLYIFTQKSGTEWETVRTTPAGMSEQVQIVYSVGMVKADDGYVYAYGHETAGFGYETYLHVARFPQDNPQQWEFFDGSGWGNAPISGATAKIADGLGTLSVCYVNGKYVALTMDQGFNCDVGRNVYISTSDSPTGPFTERKLVYTINEYFYGQYARFYTPALHPHSENGRDELLFTYSLNYSACGLSECQEGVIDPYYYRIKGVRVPYAMIGL